LPVGGTRRLLPILEKSGLKAGEDFDLVYSPERLKSQLILERLTQIPKVVGGITPEAANRAAAFYGEDYTPPKTFEEKVSTYIRHAELCVESKGEERGMKEMRKHFVQLLRGFDGASEYRAQVVQISTLAEARAILLEIVEKLQAAKLGQTGNSSTYFLS
jgi:tRNA-dihydrouridine synthase